MAYFEKIHGYSRDELLKMDVGSLRSLLHERTHHGIEVMIYRILKGKLKKPQDFGLQAKHLLELWEERRLPIDTPDIIWCKNYIDMAQRLNTGEELKLKTELPKPFSEKELGTVKKLLYERRSIRQFKDKPVPDWMIKEILYAGLMSPQGCNVDSRRFMILRDPEEWKLVSSDLPVENCIMVVVCQDMRVYKALKFDKRAPQNIFYDAAAAADHICLMAHALGLGACWMTHGEETQIRLRKHFNLHEDLVSRLHIIVGWPDEAPVKSMRMSLEDAILNKQSLNVPR
jgi:nitroreductase